MDIHKTNYLLYDIYGKDNNLGVQSINIHQIYNDTLLLERILEVENLPSFCSWATHSSPILGKTDLVLVNEFKQYMNKKQVLDTLELL